MPALKVRKKGKKDAAKSKKNEKPKFNPGPFDMKPPIKGLYLTHPRNAGFRGTLGQPCEFCGSGADDKEKVAVFFCAECDDYLCAECDKNKHEFAKYAEHVRHEWLREDAAAVLLQSEWRMMAARLLYLRMRMMVLVQRGAIEMQCLFRARVARAVLRARIAQHYELVYDPGESRHFYFNRKTQNSVWQHPPGLYYRPHWKCDHKHHHHPMVRLELAKRQTKHEAAIKIQGLYRKRKAREETRRRVRRVWSQVFDEESNSYYFEHYRTRRTAWQKPRFYGETPRKERDVCLWKTDEGGVQRWEEEGSVVAFLQAVRLPSRVIDVVRSLEITGPQLLMMDTKDFFYLGLDHLQIKRVQANLLEMTQNMRLPDDADQQLEELRSALKAKAKADHERALALQAGYKPPVPRDPVDDLPDADIFKWPERGPGDKAAQNWYRASTVYAQIGKTTTKPNAKPDPEFCDSRMYAEVNVLKETKVPLLKKYKKRELVRLAHAIQMARAFYSRADTRKKWMDLGAVEALVHAVETWLEEEDLALPLLQEGLRTIGFVAAQPAVNARLVSAGALRVARNAIARYQTHEQICVEACYIFTRFTMRPAECRYAVSAECVEAVLCALRVQEHSKEVAHWGVCVLTHVAHHREYWDHLYKNHAPVAVEAALKEHRTGGAEALLAVLTTDPDEAERERLRLEAARKQREEKRRLIRKRQQEEQKRLELEALGKLQIEYSTTQLL